MEKRDKWEEAIRAKLEHFESTPDPSDWEAIAHRLSDKTPVIRMKSQSNDAAGCVRSIKMNVLDC